jgi:hypothetical protein
VCRRQRFGDFYELGLLDGINALGKQPPGIEQSLPGLSEQQLGPASICHGALSAVNAAVHPPHAISVWLNQQI